MKKVKRANGNGFCYKIDNNPNRKNPYVYGFTVDWTDDGKPIKKILGYTTSEAKGRKELDKYLASDNKEVLNDITWQELYNKWLKYKENTGVAKTGLQHYTNAYNKTLILNKTKFADITIDIMQKVIDNSGVKTDGQKRIRNLYSQLHQYAKIIGVKTSADFSKFLVVSKEEKSTKHTIFTKEEINKLWNNRNDFIDVILFMIYTGIRPNELFKISEYNEKYFVTGSKTEAGKNRQIPIHNDLKDIYLTIETKINKIKKSYFYSTFKQELDNLSIEHYPYDTRHTFGTCWKLSNADTFARKKIMGHAEKDLTNNVYTHLDTKFLYYELNKVTFK